ncbi:hypothetical protein BGZ83_011635 [Gryganskiella cystojenkinii]|nr:hypothetical protein BGZ83_011635 [Gryganskiella cystojenkinii]
MAPQTSAERPMPTYDLNAIVVHGGETGETAPGFYSAYVRKDISLVESVSGKVTRHSYRWLCYDDSRVQPVPDEYIQEIIEGGRHDEKSGFITNPVFLSYKLGVASQDDTEDEDQEEEYEAEKGEEDEEDYEENEEGDEEEYEENGEE